LREKVRKRRLHELGSVVTILPSTSRHIVGYFTPYLKQQTAMGSFTSIKIACVPSRYRAVEFLQLLEFSVLIHP
jgi:hypothetical protein